MPNIDLILVLESLGYTSREASFLYLVAVHSGYFVRRQFDYFIDRQKGAISQNLIEKARIAGHIAVLDYGQGRHVYHLFFRPIYRLLGKPDSQNRRRKGDGCIRARLMALDYVLENLDEHYLESDEEKSDYFADVRHVSRETFLDPQNKLLSPLESLPISIVDRMQPATSPVRFAFIDEGLLTTTKFARCLRIAKPLLNALSGSEIIYAANSKYNFAAAQDVFQRCFPPSASSHQQTLAAEWRNDSFIKNRTASVPESRPTFTTLLFHYSYPSIQRKESASLSTFRPWGLSEEKETSKTEGLTQRPRSPCG